MNSTHALAKATTLPGRSRVMALILAAALLVSLLPAAASAATKDTLLLSVSSDYKTTVPLDGAVVNDHIWVRTASKSSRVDFAIDGVLFRSDTSHPHTLTWSKGYDTNSIKDGLHTITATVRSTATAKPYKLSATFMVKNAKPAPVAATTDDALLYSVTSDYGNLAALDGAVVKGDLWVQTAQKAANVDFHIDGAYFRSDTSAPHTLRWNTPQDTTTMTEGTHTITAEVTRTDGSRYTVTAHFTVDNQPDEPVAEAPVSTASDTLLYSATSDYANLAALDGALVKGDLWVQTTQQAAQVDFSIDGAYFRSDTNYPHTLRWNTPQDTTTMPEGAHTITAEVTRTDGSRYTVTAAFTVDNVADTPNLELTPTPEQVTGRDGLTFTAAELEVWRDRAVNGPFKSEGDAGANTPGDWHRISKNADTFLANPGAAVWAGPQYLDGSGCVRQISGTTNNNNPPRIEPTNLRDAAFYALVADSDIHRQAVRQILLAQADIKQVDFSNTALYCMGAMADGSPTFDIANWLTKLLYAYDYVGPDAFTAEERNRLNKWFYDAAAFWARYTDADLNRLFVDRPNGNYELTSVGRSMNGPDVGYYGSTPTYPIHRYYNNRKAARYRYVAAAAVKLRNDGFRPSAGPSLDHLQESTKKFVREWVTYSVFPGGWIGEFERWTSTNPDLGLSYANVMIGSVVATADLLARAGDTELLTFSTTDGALGTESVQPKSLTYVVKEMAKYTTGEHRRYGTDRSDLSGGSSYLIDGVNGNWISLFDLHALPLLRHQRVDGVREVMMRTAPGLGGFPVNPANGHHIIWTGDWGTLPGLLFMYG